MFDYLIVGQGIAGTVLAHTLLQHGHTVFIVDNSLQTSSSIVAAGIYNPVTGKRMVKTWLADLLFPFLKEFYTKMEALLQVRLLEELDIYKPFDSFAEQNHFFTHHDGLPGRQLKSGSDTQYSTYVRNPYGGFTTSNGGYLHIQTFIQKSTEYFKVCSIYQKEQFHYHDVEFNEGFIGWKNITTKKLIFCEGYQTINNPFFSWLPFVLTKGEILQVHLENFPEKVIFNKSVFVLPIGDAQYKVGSTYQWNFDNDEITSDGFNELNTKLKAVIKAEPNHVNHQAGIRPTVSDRRPILGFHPQYRQIGIFNGLGTKGVSLAPFFADHFVKYLRGELTMMEEISIERFYHLFLST